MQAILKGKHQRFCEWLREIKSRHAINDCGLNDLEAEMLNKYKGYQQKMEELQQIIQEYEEKRKAIQEKIRSNRRFNLVPKTVK